MAGQPQGKGDTVTDEGNQDLTLLEAADFQPEVGSGFSVVSAGHGVQIELRLTAVEVRGHGGDGGRDPFALHFCGPVEPVLTHDTHLVHHPRLGRAPLFLGPIGRDEDGALRYEAIFG
jgi:hypothetical protein